MEGKQLDDIDVLRQMYAVLCGGVDDALTLLEAGNVWEARQVLQRGLLLAENYYISGMSAGDELAE